MHWFAVAVVAAVATTVVQPEPHHFHHHHRPGIGALAFVGVSVFYSHGLVDDASKKKKKIVKAFQITNYNHKIVRNNS